MSIYICVIYIYIYVCVWGSDVWTCIYIYRDSFGHNVILYILYAYILGVSPQIVNSPGFCETWVTIASPILRKRRPRFLQSVDTPNCLWPVLGVYALLMLVMMGIMMNKHEYSRSATNRKGETPVGAFHSLSCRSIGGRFRGISLLSNPGVALKAPKQSLIWMGERGNLPNQSILRKLRVLVWELRVVPLADC